MLGGIGRDGERDRKGGGKGWGGEGKGRGLPPLYLTFGYGPDPKGRKTGNCILLVGPFLCCCKFPSVFMKIVHR